MGQQQLLLVILVTIIVGIATVVAINTFGSAADSANVDAVRNDMASIAASAQGYYMKPAMMAGGGQDFTNMGFDDIAFASEAQITAGSATKVTNSNGTYQISGGSKTEFTLTASPSQAGGTITATITKDNMTLTDYDPTGSIGG